MEKGGFVLKVSKMRCLIADDLKSQRSCFNAILSCFFRSVTFPVTKARQQDRSQRNLAKPRTSFCRIIGRIFPNPCLTDSDRLPACLTHEGFPQICSATALFKASKSCLAQSHQGCKSRECGSPWRASCPDRFRDCTQFAVFGSSFFELFELFASMSISDIHDIPLFPKACRVDDEVGMKKRVGSPGYVAPEIITHRPYNEKVA